MSSPIQEIKDRLDIVEFIRSYIPLQPAGKNFKALCPFHKEKTPSFMVSPERQTWHCFGACGEGGDVFKFLMKYENLEFYEALKVLAERAGVELKKISPAEHKQIGVLYEINESAKNFFKKQLEQSSEILSYLRKRGLKKETIQEFDLGLAPSAFDDLTHYLINSGYDFRDIERAGLNLKTERGSYIDRFRGRIIFPLYNHFGKVVGFSGRMIERETSNLAKYVNSPESSIFNKSRILYGFHKTKESIRKSKTAFLVEGQMDFLMAYQDGIKNVIATSGTALTPEHLKTLRRLAEKLILCFDNDEAGLKAVERAIDLANANDFGVKILMLQDFKDPAEAVQKSPGALSKLIKNAKPAMEFYFERYLALNGKEQETGGDLAEFKKNIRIVLSKIKRLASPVESSYWLKELSLKTKIEEKTLAEEMEQIKTQNYSVHTEINAVKSQRESATSRRDLIAQRLIGLIVARDEFKDKISEYTDYLPADYLKILRSLNREMELEEEKLSNLLNLISLRSSFESSILDEEKIEQEFQDLLCQLKVEYLKEKRRGLVCLVKEAEANGEETKINELLQEFNQLNQSIL